MKTGFICASGFNLVATATRGGKRLIAVVLGAKSSASRTIKAAQLFERGFRTDPFGWLMPSPGTVDSLVPIAAMPPDLHEEICSNHRRRPNDDGEEGGEAGTAQAGAGADLGEQQYMLPLANPRGAPLLTSGLAAGIAPIEVYTGPARSSVPPSAAEGPVPAPKKKPDSTAVAAKPPAAKPTPMPVARPVTAAAGTPKSATAASGTKPLAGSNKGVVTSAGSKAKSTVAASPKQPSQTTPKTETQ